SHVAAKTGKGQRTDRSEFASFRLRSRREESRAAANYSEQRLATTAHEFHCNLICAINCEFVAV
ncbi:MAG TPA: hypothetical protein VIV60_20005, partial [Polyangiaceae bacterium]